MALVDFQSTIQGSDSQIMNKYTMMQSLISINQDVVYRNDYGSIFDGIVGVGAILVILWFVYFLSYQLYCAVRYLVRWYHDGDEVRARKVISDFDNHEDTDLDIAVDMTYPDARVRVFKMRRMAYAMAYRAHFQFGHRPESEANILITRKFLRDSLSELKDMRFKDMSVVIDIALPLSFLPSLAMQEMNEIRDTNEYRSRMQPVRPRSWTSWWYRTRKASGHN